MTRSHAVARCLLGAIGFLLAGAAIDAQELIEVTYRDQSFLGAPLFVSENQTLLLARDGRLRRLPGTGQAQIASTAEPFSSYTAIELQTRLHREFGDTFEVTRTPHYVVVHPEGESRLWPARFEQLYQNFVHYFACRGWVPQDPDFPLVALVFHDRAGFLAYAQRMHEPVTPNIIGYYSPRTNRIALYRSSGKLSAAEAWAQDAATIYHEAAHQAAFNTGLHHRFTGPPRWVSEGLGTLFEAPGVWNASEHPQRSKRINRRMLVTLRGKVNPDEPDLRLEELIDSDRLFETDPQRAYATAWALSFYLSEMQAHDYVTYIQQTADKPAFQRVLAEERLRDWKRAFKMSPDALEPYLWEFLSQLD